MLLGGTSLFPVLQGLGFVIMIKTQGKEKNTYEWGRWKNRDLYESVKFLVLYQKQSPSKRYSPMLEEVKLSV